MSYLTGVLLCLLPPGPALTLRPLALPSMWLERERSHGQAVAWAWVQGIYDLGLPLPHTWKATLGSDRLLVPLEMNTGQGITQVTEAAEGPACENTDMRHLRTRLHVSSLVSDAAHYPEGEDSP